ncbi:hypothetical protein BLNAU_20074 [Blattamonas nauphoetae]|uniref:Uncharacterized protein n=1 Tax=Blattamonas nauphoetae TaxID=2049346 RepID=A0ABQ9X240_9EUKA|nr:hypothetical protein BLNAU_20074 [Blattamonas nauphoetae]
MTSSNRTVIWVFITVTMFVLTQSFHFTLTPEISQIDSFCESSFSQTKQEFHPIEFIDIQKQFLYCQCGNSDVATNALFEEIRTQSLSSHIHQFESGDESLSWTRLMEWFVEAVIGAELFRNEHPSAPPLTFENIRIDSSSTIVIAFPSSPDEPSISGSLSSDISTLCSFFLHIHRTLESNNRLIIPLHPKHDNIVFSRFMVCLVEHFVASGDLILPNSSPKDHSQYFADSYRALDANVGPSSSPFLLHNLVTSFTRFIQLTNNRNCFLLPEHSFLRGKNVESSEQLLDAVKKVKEAHSLEAIRKVFYDWAEWEKMMVTIEDDATLGTDLSFLQSRCLRTTLLSLQSKHQIRANQPPTEKNRESDSSSNEMNTSITHVPSEIDVTWNLMDVGPSQLSTAISTQTSLPSDQSSSEPQALASEHLIFTTEFARHHSQQILSMIHLHLSRPPHTSFPWNNRPLNVSDSVVDATFQPPPQFVDQNEKFDISLFDQSDDVKVVASLRRCHAVLEATNSTECMVDIDTFRTSLVSGLHSSNFAIQMECQRLFFRSAELLHIADDPFNTKFQNLHKAFRDGTICEKIALLHLWMRWFQFTAMGGHGRMMVESDFDFDGFLAADLGITLLFDEACCFVERIVIIKTVSMSFRWKLYFLHSFEKRHQMMLRLSSDQSPSSKQERPSNFMSPFAITLGSFLSVFRGCDFPSALTELITTVLDQIPHMMSPQVNPAYFLNHTSINPKHRHSFFPMDLMFERYFRNDPDTFFEIWADPALARLLLTLIVDHSAQDTTQVDIRRIFCYFPPPRLFDAFLSPLRLIGSSYPIEMLILATFCDFGVYTAPFGDCSSLAKVFKMLIPFDSNPDQVELNRLSVVGETVVSLHWLNIPSHFDSPLLCHLPSLAGAQRGVLQTLSSLSGIPSLITPNTPESDWNRIRIMMSNAGTTNERVHILSQCVRRETYFDFCSPSNALFLMIFITRLVLSRLPAHVSVALEFIHRLISVSSDAVRIELVKQGLLDHVVFAVSNSSFLDDYEKGIAVIGILLATIRRVEQKWRMRKFDFFRGLNARPRSS